MLNITHERRQDQPSLTLNPFTYMAALGSATLNFLTPTAAENDTEKESQDDEAKIFQVAHPSYAQAVVSSNTALLNSTQPSVQISMSNNQQNGPRASFCKRCQSNCCDCLQITGMVTGACVVGAGACVVATAACIADTALNVVLCRRTIIIVQEPRNRANK